MSYLMEKLEVARAKYESLVEDNFGYDPDNEAANNAYKDMKDLEISAKTLIPEEYQEYEDRNY